MSEQQNDTKIETPKQTGTKAATPAEREVEEKVEAQEEEEENEKPKSSNTLEVSSGARDDGYEGGGGGQKGAGRVRRTRSNPRRRTNRSPSVSFREPCGDMVEIDLEAAVARQKGSSDDKKKPPFFRSVRYYVMLLALVSPFVVTYSRTIINFAITEMIDSVFLEKAGHKDQITPPPLLANNTSAAYFDLDNSCPVDEETRERLLADLGRDEKQARESKGEKFAWDMDKQGYLKGSYAVGHALLQIVGGRLSEIYGSHTIMSISSILIGICCLSAPILAATSYYLLFMDLFVLGMLGSFMTPALITLSAAWLTPTEKSLMITFYLVSSRLGYALSSALCGFLISAQLSWSYLFYSAGWIALVFACVFYLCASSRPQDHFLVGPLELEYIASKNTLVRESLARSKEAKVEQPIELKVIGVDNDKSKTGEKQQVATADSVPKSNKKSPSNVPWLAIITSRPVWAFVITKFCVKMAGDTVQTELPNYWKRVMHFSGKNNGLSNSWNYIIFCVSCLAVGALAKTINKKRPFGMSKTAVRKSFQCIASFGVALCLLGIALSVCQETWTKVFLTLLFILTTFSTGGEAQAPMDISERYSGTIHAIGSSLAISGAVAPTLVGLYLKGRAADRDRWADVWLGSSLISALGGLVFLLFADATIQPFDSIGIEKNVVKIENASEKPNSKANGKDNLAFDANGDPSAVVKPPVKMDQQEEEKQPPYRESRVI